MRVPIILRAATCCILVLVLALVQSLAGVARAAVEPTLTERLGLRDFYDSTGGVTSWTRKWDTNTEPCEGGWYGVVCDPRGHIIEFQLVSSRIGCSLRGATLLDTDNSLPLATHSLCNWT